MSANVLRATFDIHCVNCVENIFNLLYARYEWSASVCD